MSKESLRQICRDVGMALNTRELLILEKAFSSEDNAVNYESMYRLLADTQRTSFGSDGNGSADDPANVAANAATLQSIRQKIIPRLNPQHSNNLPILLRSRSY